MPCNQLLICQIFKKALIDKSRRNFTGFSKFLTNKMYQALSTAGKSVFTLCLILCFMLPAFLGAQHNRQKTLNHIPYLSNYQRIKAGGEHSLEIRNGELWAWGNNDNGQLGDGTNVQRTVPVRIGSATNWVLVASDRNHSLGIKSDGTLWAWGLNNRGQLGDGSTTDRWTPVQIGTATPIG